MTMQAGNGVLRAGTHMVLYNFWLDAILFALGTI